MNETILVAGDLMLGDSSTGVGFGLHSRFPGARAAELFTEFKPLTSGAALVFGNLECLLTHEGLGTSRWKRDQMRADPAVAGALASAGFTVLSVANNHANQHGHAAFHDTVKHLRAAGIVPVGVRGTAPWQAHPETITTPSGKRIGVLAYCWRPRQYEKSVEPPFAEGDLAGALADIARLRPACDTVLVSLHWGDEFLGQPSAAQADAARQLVAAGAAMVIGHHPHVTRPVEQVGAGVVAYSLGNVISDMLWLPELRRGTVLRVELTDSGARVQQGWSALTSRKGVQLRPENSVVSAATPLAEEEYQRQVAGTVSRQRMAAYGYALRNIWRFPPAVLAELLFRTGWNRVRAIVGIKT